MARPPRTPRPPAQPDLVREVALRGDRRRPADVAQPRLAFDPMPERIEPCLALLASVPPEGPDWAFEIKWDGYRLAIHREPDRVRILTRGGHDWSHRFPNLVEAAQQLETGGFILDGEAVVLDAAGQPSFSALQAALGGRGGKRVTGDAVLYAFDLLYVDGHDLTGMALAERRQMLEQLIAGRTGPIRLSEEIEADGRTLLRSACAHGLEGIIAKSRSRPYRSGRSGDWLKIKCVQSESFAIVGYLPSTRAKNAIASLILAGRKNGVLVHVGNVGTGFSSTVLAELKRRLDDLRTGTPALAIKGRDLVFAEPRLIAEIEFRAWTGDGRLRHASFKGLRERADHDEIFEVP